jgi:hypothetical protein
MMYFHFACLIASNLHDLYSLNKDYSCEQMKKNEVGGGCSTMGRGGEGYIQELFR